MAAGAATLWAINGVVSKVMLEGGISSLRLAQVRSTGGCAALVLVLLVSAPSRLRARLRELPYLAVFGICGLAFVQWLYFLAIHRLAIGIALLIAWGCAFGALFWCFVAPWWTFPAERVAADVSLLGRLSDYHRCGR